MKKITYLPTLLSFFTLSLACYSQLVNVNAFHIRNPFNITMKVHLAGGVLSQSLIVSSQSAGIFNVPALNTENYGNFSIHYQYDDECFRYDLAALEDQMKQDLLLIQFLEALLKNSKWEIVWPLIRDTSINSGRRRNYRFSTEIRAKYKRWLNSPTLGTQTRNNILDALQLVQIAELVNLPLYSQRVDALVKQVFEREQHDLPLSHFVTTARSTILQFESGLLMNSRYALSTPVKGQQFASMKQSSYYQLRAKLFLQKPGKVALLGSAFNSISIGLEQSPALFSSINDTTAIVSATKGLSYTNADISVGFEPVNFYSADLEAKPFLNIGIAATFRKSFALRSATNQFEKTTLSTSMESFRGVFSIGVLLRLRQIFFKGAYFFTGFAAPTKAFKNNYLKNSQEASLSIAFPLLLTSKQLRYR